MRGVGPTSQVFIRPTATSPSVAVQLLRRLLKVVRRSVRLMSACVAVITVLTPRVPCGENQGRIPGRRWLLQGDHAELTELRDRVSI